MDYQVAHLDLSATGSSGKILSNANPPRNMQALAKAEQFVPLSMARDQIAKVMHEMRLLKDNHQAALLKVDEKHKVIQDEISDYFRAIIEVRRKYYFCCYYIGFDE